MRCITTFCTRFGVEIKDENECDMVLSGRTPTVHTLESMIEYMRKFVKRVNSESKIVVKIYKPDGSDTFIDNLAIAAGIRPEDVWLNKDNENMIGKNILLESCPDSFVSCLTHSADDTTKYVIKFKCS